MRWLAAALLLVAACSSEKQEPAHAQPVAVKTPPKTPPVVEKEKEPDVAPTLEDSTPRGGGDGKLYVYFLDVGEGDATLIVSPVGRTVLIDAGPQEAVSHLNNRLSELVTEPIDLIVVTHPHADHFGGVREVLKSVGAKRFLAPRLTSDDADYAVLQADLKARNIPTFVPAPDPKAPGEPLKLELGGGAELVVFWPRQPVEALLEADGRTTEANALVSRVQFGDTSLLLESDAQAETESLLLNKKLPFQSTLLKVAAHGGDVASTAPFLKAVNPLAAIISVGAGNKLSVPSHSVIDRLESGGAKVFRTDLDGEIEAVSDGKSFAVSVEKPAAGVDPGTEQVFQRDAPARSWVNPQAGKTHVKLASTKVDLSDSKKTDPQPKDDGQYKKVVKVDPDSLIPDSVKEKYGSKQKAGGKVLYVASKNAKVFHMPDCIWAKRIKKENLLTFTSRNEAAKKLKPAGDCNP